MFVIFVGVLKLLKLFSRTLCVAVSQNHELLLVDLVGDSW